jgi:glycosyltransferase involved in cell wall biosynthesis
MKVVHLCLGSFYPDNYLYQENLLPKFHKELGYDVEIIASTKSFDEHGKICFLTNTGTYQNEYDIKVTRLSYKSKNKIWKKLKRYRGTYEAIEKASPEILFIHGGQFLDINQVVKYLKNHHNVIVYVDNHADFSNSATNWVSKYILHKIVWKHTEHQIEPYTKKFYGVLPARVDFLKNVYGLPAEKCELLVMGADDEFIQEAKELSIRPVMKEKYGISEDDFLVVTGGKVNQYRPEVLNLMRAVTDINRSNVKLLVFGNASDEFKTEFETLCSKEQIIYVGWLKSKDTYKVIETADLVVFPGLHSVMWEQAVAQGKPCIFRDIEGFHHVDIGGNADFVSDVSVQGLKEALLSVIDNPARYQEMKKVAEEKGMKIFSYRDIARRSIDQ